MKKILLLFLLLSQKIYSQEIILNTIKSNNLSNNIYYQDEQSLNIKKPKKIYKNINAINFLTNKNNFTIKNYNNVIPKITINKDLIFDEKDNTYKPKNKIIQKKIIPLIGFGYGANFTDKFKAENKSTKLDSIGNSLFLSIDMGIINIKNKLYMGINFEMDFNPTYIHKINRGNAYSICGDIRYISYLNPLMLGIKTGYGSTLEKDDFYKLKVSVGAHLFHHNSFIMDISYTLNVGNNFDFHILGTSFSYIFNLSKRNKNKD